jgi:hypothetical protein
MSASAALPTERAVGSDGPAGASLTAEPCWRYRMIAHADPGLLPRLLAPIAKLGLVPDRCSFTRRDDGLASIELAVGGVTRLQADHLRLVYSVMPAMRAVELVALAG